MQIRDGGSRSAESPARAEPPSGQGFEPREFEAFRFTGADFDPASATAVLRYALDDAFEFEETIRFLGAGATAVDPDDERLRRALNLLHLLAGVSYFKTAAPPEIRVETGPLSAREAALGYHRSPPGRRAVPATQHPRRPPRGAPPVPPSPPPPARPGPPAPRPGPPPPRPGAPPLPRRTAVPVGG